MIKCLCGKEIATVPDWLATVNVQFICNNCPNRELQGITQVDLTGGRVEEDQAKKTVDDASDNVNHDEDEEEED